MKNLKEMSNRIKNRRKEMGFTQESFSEIANLSISSYTKIENAFQKPALDALIKISEHLDLSLDYIVFGIEERAPKSARSAEILNSLLDYADDEKMLYIIELLTRMVKVKKAE